MADKHLLHPGMAVNNQLLKSRKCYPDRQTNNAYHQVSRFRQHQASAPCSRCGVVVVPWAITERKRPIWMATILIVEWP